MPKTLSLVLLALFPLALLAQAPAPAGGKADVLLHRDGAPPRWAIAIHGGAGVIPKTMPEATKREYFQSLTAALKAGQEVLTGGGTSLDAVEKVVRTLEDDPHFNAGKGAVYTHDG